MLLTLSTSIISRSLLCQVCPYAFLSSPAIPDPPDPQHNTHTVLVSTTKQLASLFITWEPLILTIPLIAVILTVNEICREYRANRRRKANSNLLSNTQYIWDVFFGCYYCLKQLYLISENKNFGVKTLWISLRC